MSLLILGTSIVLQLVTAGFALRLVRLTNFMAAWLLIASALLLMSARRTLVLYDMILGDGAGTFNLTAEGTALLISFLMLCGVILIRPVILSFQNTEKNLRQSEAIYRDILENMIDTYYRTDKNGLIVMASDSASDLLGYPVDELIGKSLSSLYVNPGDRDNFLERLNSEGRLQKQEGLLRHKDGSHVVVEVNTRLLLDSEGNTFGVEGIVRNITERKRAEQLNVRLGRIIEDSVNEVYAFDGDTLAFTLVNRGACRNLGYTMDELLKLTPLDLKPEFDLAGFTQLIQPLRDASMEVLSFETLHRRKDGTTYPVEIRLQHARGEDPPLFLAIVQDITERKHSEAQLSHASKMEAVGQLTGGIAHDFNNLLTVIQGNIELTLQNLPVESAHYLTDALAAAEKGATLTQHLLAFSRKQALKPEVIDLRMHISAMSDLLHRTLREDIEIEITGSAGLWRCEVDPAQLENALLNLAINASDAMPDGGKLTIETSNTSLDEQFTSQHFETKPGQYVLMAVSDTGTGMSPKVLSQVFDPFFTTKEESKGSGLGLSMVYGFVKQSGGSVDIYSEIDEGTTVNIYLPRSQGTISEEVAARNISGESAGEGEVILVVEDNPDLGHVVTEMLDSLGYVSFYSPDVPQAIKLLESTDRVDLLLTDVILKGSEKGTDLARLVRERWPETAILYMAGYSENAIIHDGRLDPGVELLPKPFSRQKLSEKISRLLADNQASRALLYRTNPRTLASLSCQ